MNAALFSSGTDEWATPQALFDELDREFHFDLDPCADDHNHKCARYFTKSYDGLAQSWGGIACFAIPHTGGRSGSGSRKHTTRGTRKTRLSCCCFPHERTPGTSTITSCIGRKYALSLAA